MPDHLTHIAESNLINAILHGNFHVKFSRFLVTTN